MRAHTHLTPVRYVLFFVSIISGLLPTTIHANYDSQQLSEEIEEKLITYAHKSPKYYKHYCSVIKKNNGKDAGLDAFYHLCYFTQKVVGDPALLSLHIEALFDASASFITRTPRASHTDLWPVMKKALKLVAINLTTLPRDKFEKVRERLTRFHKPLRKYCPDVYVHGGDPQYSRFTQLTSRGEKQDGLSQKDRDKVILMHLADTRFVQRNERRMLHDFLRRRSQESTTDQTTGALTKTILEGGIFPWYRDEKGRTPLFWIQKTAHQRKLIETLTKAFNQAAQTHIGVYAKLWDISQERDRLGRKPSPIHAWKSFRSVLQGTGKSALVDAGKTTAKMALVGALFGTAVLPGVGTLAGAAIVGGVGGCIGSTISLTSNMRKAVWERMKYRWKQKSRRNFQRLRRAMDRIGRNAFLGIYRERLFSTLLAQETNCALTGEFVSDLAASTNGWSPERCEEWYHSVMAITPKGEAIKPSDAVLVWEELALPMRRKTLSRVYFAQDVREPIAHWYGNSLSEEQHTSVISKRHRIAAGKDQMVRITGENKSERRRYAEALAHGTRLYRITGERFNSLCSGDEVNYDHPYYIRANDIDINGILFFEDIDTIKDADSVETCCYLIDKSSALGIPVFFSYTREALIAKNIRLTIGSNNSDTKGQTS